MATVRENLIAAKALINTPEKWGKGAYVIRPGCYCVFGAVAMVRNVPPACAEIGEIADALYDALPGDNLKYHGVVDFNDDPSTTHADIMALFQRAIDAEEKKEARS